ncbi:hypothetical protein PO909_027605 [Leuciscus waleckii]
MEGDPVTLNTDVQTNQQELIRWYFNGIRIAQITGDLSDICTDVQCDEGNERFRGRLELDYETGSLTIMNTGDTDSGDYKLEIISDRFSEKIFSVSVTGVFDYTEEVSVLVMEGDSVTLNSGVLTNQQDSIRWYYNDILICNEGNEGFRDRLKLDHQTGSLTIMNTRNRHTGEYTLVIISISSRFSEKIYSVYVYGESSCLKASLVHFNHIINVFNAFVVTFRAVFYFSFPIFI